ncbi:biotin transporter BioY [Francisellaceae bacterium CB300]|jgi:biotin transport system substrate-specific component
MSLNSIKTIIIKGLLLSFLVLLLAISARIKINLIPDSLPLTLQTYAICLTTIFLSIDLAIYSVFLYVSLGILGLPVFAGGASGVDVLFGYSGGYIIGFLLATTTIYTIRKIRLIKLNGLNVFIYSLVIHLIIIICGFIWLGALKGYSFSFHNGLLPLLIPALIKSLIVILTFQIYRKAMIIIKARSS